MATRYPVSCAIALAIWVVCLIPIPETPLDGVSFIDKWTHFVMYGTLTAAIWVEYDRRHKKDFSWKRLLTGGILCPILMGCLVELAQAYLTTCRSGDVFDALCNALGVLLGAAIGRLVI
ncbi:MAG: VanZ family protein [Prevotella sp.]|nr:VanZ family protein [Prevotella sp.]